MDYTDTEQEVNEALKRYTELQCSGAKDDKVELVATEFVLKLLKKRLFSSPAAFLSTLQQHEKTVKEGKSRSHRQLSKPSVSILRRQLDQIQEDFADDDIYEESTNDAIASSSQLFHSLSAEEQDLLRFMQSWAETASTRPDAKAQALLDWINTHIRPDGQWSDQRVIIFTEYRTTQKWLFDLLAIQGLAQDERLMTLYGGMNSDERERVKAAFQAGPDISNVRILLATDAASEGLDLQTTVLI